MTSLGCSVDEQMLALLANMLLSLVSRNLSHVVKLIELNDNVYIGDLIRCDVK